MKTIIALLTVCIFSLNAVAQEYDKTQKSATTTVKYCAKMQNGKIMMMQDNRDITADVALANGTTLEPDGTVIKSDGSQSMLKNGECIDMNGNRVNPKENDNMKTEDEYIPPKE